MKGGIVSTGALQKFSFHGRLARTMLVYRFAPDKRFKFLFAVALGKGLDMLLAKKNFT